MTSVVDEKVNVNTQTEKEAYESVDITYAFGIQREQMDFEAKIIFDTWYKNSLLMDEDVEDNNTLITKSNIEGSGEGLFANKDFKEGDLITEYPSYNLTINQTCVGFKKGKAYKIPLEELFSKWENCVLSSNILCFDIVETPKNERFKCHKTNDNSYRENITKEEYLSTKNQLLNNCKFDDLFSLYAKRDILKGEELYVGYGVAYWTSFGKIDLSEVNSE